MSVYSNLLGPGTELENLNNEFVKLKLYFKPCERMSIQICFESHEFQMMQV